MFHSASIQSPSAALLHELSRSASSLFIIATLSFWVVNYWFCLSLCRNHAHKYYAVFVLQGRARAFWGWNGKKGPPCPGCNFYCPHSDVIHNTANKTSRPGTHAYLPCVCAHAFSLLQDDGVKYLWHILLCSTLFNFYWIIKCSLTFLGKVCVMCAFTASGADTKHSITVWTGSSPDRFWQRLVRFSWYCPAGVISVKHAKQQ